MKSKALNVTLLLVLLTLFSCTSPTPYDISENRDGVFMDYTILYIEGMPCLFWSRNLGEQTGTAGITCDWSRWKGE